MPAYWNKVLKLLKDLVFIITLASLFFDDSEKGKEINSIT